MFIRDEELDFNQHSSSAKATDVFLATELCNIRDQHVRVNQHHKVRVTEICKLPYYNDIPILQIHLGCTIVENNMSIDVNDGMGLEDDDDPELDEDDTVNTELANVELFFEQLSVCAVDNE
jgi:hypothetical protein